MFVQIHMLQSLPPGNVNRDGEGYPKRCVFGGVTRGRISSQSLKRSIRRSPEFRDAWGGDMAERTLYLPRMVADELRNRDLGVPADEVSAVMKGIADKFKADRPASASEAGEEEPSESAISEPTGPDKTKQLVFFPPSFAPAIAELVAGLRASDRKAYDRLCGRSLGKAENDAADKRLHAGFIQDAAKASRMLTVDIGLFGRMTTSDLVDDVEASCQVAHAISTNEAMLESDYFTAMDDRQQEYDPGQGGAAFIGQEAFFNSAVYYKYLNVDTDSLADHLPALTPTDLGKAAGTLVAAAALANPSGKQNSFAAHGLPELVFVETWSVKRPVSYANAFLQAVEGGAGRNLMTESASALYRYVDGTATAFAPANTERDLLAVGNAAGPTLAANHRDHGTLDDLAKSVASRVAAGHQRG